MSFIPFGVPFEELPEHVQEQIKHQRMQNEAMEIEGDMMRRDLLDLFESVPASQLVALRNLLGAVAIHPHIAKFYEGMIALTLHKEHGYCWHCNQKHEENTDSVEEFARMLAEGKVDVEFKADEDAPDDGDDEPDDESDDEMEPGMYATVDPLKTSSGDGTPSLFEGRIDPAGVLDVLAFDFPHGGAEVTDEVRAAISAIAYRAPLLPLAEKAAAYAAEYGVDDVWEVDDEDPSSVPMFVNWMCVRCGNYTWPSLQDRMLAKPDLTGCPGCIHKQKWG